MTPKRPRRTVRLHDELSVPKYPRVWAEIDCAALAANYRELVERVRQVSPHTRPIAVVKADAYSHGIRPVLLTLLAEGCRAFAVACIEEAVAARKIIREVCPRDADTDVLILGWTHPDGASRLAEYSLTATVLSLDYAQALSDEATRQGVTVSCHIALDTGMNRIGISACSDEEIAAAVRDIETVQSMKALSVAGLFTHLAKADEDIAEMTDEESLTRRQYRRYAAVLDALARDGRRPRTCHVCNSAAAVRFPDYIPDGCLDAVRLGISLYGYGVDAPDGTPVADRPVMRLCTSVVHVHTLLAGESVGYGGEYTADTPRTLATLPIGYADGFVRACRGASVAVHTAHGVVKAPIVGRICMDQCMIDVTDLGVSVGDEVTVFGDARTTLISLCERADTIPYELLCLVTARVPRLVL